MMENANNNIKLELRFSTKNAPNFKDIGRVFFNVRFPVSVPQVVKGCAKVFNSINGVVAGQIKAEPDKGLFVAIPVVKDPQKAYSQGVKVWSKKMGESLPLIVEKIMAKNNLPFVISNQEKASYYGNANDSLGQLNIIDNQIQGAMLWSHDKVTKILDSFANQMNSPQMQKLLSKISTFGIKLNPDFKGVYDLGDAEYGSVKYLLSKLSFSERNRKWILKQWIDYGKADAPTIIATQDQWLAVGREVVNNYPLFAERPNGYQKMGARGAENITGINQDTINTTYGNDSNIVRSYDKIKGWEQLDARRQFSLAVYYDYSDTIEIPNDPTWQMYKEEFLEKGASMTNYGRKFNDVAISHMSDNEKNSLGQLQTQDDVANSGSAENNQNDWESQFVDNADNKVALRDAIRQLISMPDKNGENTLNPKYKDTYQTLTKSPNNFDSILHSYFSHEAYLDRMKNPTEKQKLIRLCVATTESMLSVNSAGAIKQLSALKNDLTNEKFSMISNMVLKVANKTMDIQNNSQVTESKMIMEGNYFTVDDVISAMGETPDHLKQIFKMNQQKEAELQAEEKQFKSSFVNMWNRIIEANQKNHDVIW